MEGRWEIVTSALGTALIFLGLAGFEEMDSSAYKLYIICELP